jgi:tetratricopeptide (TPR) repeat protein
VLSRFGAFVALMIASNSFAQPGSPTIERADRELAEGRFREALASYREVIDSSPDDRHALREAGRAAHALQDFASAADLLARADALTHERDPELHFLLGEAEWALGRAQRAFASYAIVLSELGDAPTGRMERLWRARVASRLGDRKTADAIYEAMTAESPADAEVVFAHTEMHAGAHEWDDADRAIRRYLARDPSNTRARALLAWIDEARGQLDGELATRASLADRGDADKDSVRDYGRALERAGDWAAARDAYARAMALPGGADDAELASALERVGQRMSLEVAAGAVGRTDPMASSLGAFTGVAVPFGAAHHVTLAAWNDRVIAGARTASVGEALAAVTLHGRENELVLGATVGLIGNGMPIAGAIASASSGLLFSHLKLAIDGQLHSVWHETPVVELEGGSFDAITARGDGVLLDNRLVIEAGAQARQFRLAGATSDASARQELAWAGADFVVWRNFAHEARGQILDDTLLHATYTADSAVVSYRHYEVTDRADQMFDARLALAPRASIDEVSAVARKVVARGRIAAEVRAGFGHDWIRQLAIAHGGASLWLALGSSSRLALSFDLAKESIGTFQGERRGGWVSYHVDL